MNKYDFAMLLLETDSDTLVEMYEYLYDTPVIDMSCYEIRDEILSDFDNDMYSDKIYTFVEGYQYYE